MSGASRRFQRSHGWEQAVKHALDSSGRPYVAIMLDTVVPLGVEQPPGRQASVMFRTLDNRSAADLLRHWAAMLEGGGSA